MLKSFKTCFLCGQIVSKNLELSRSITVFSARLAIRAVQTNKTAAVSASLQKSTKSLNATPVVFSRSLFTHNVQLSSENQNEELQKHDPFHLVADHLGNLCSDINQELLNGCRNLDQLSTYHFDGQGKAFRPMIVLLMAMACNGHISGDSQSYLLHTQKKIAQITEMIHVASLIHDDVIDAAELRRNQQSVQKAWGQRKAILTANYILGVSSEMLAKLENKEVIKILCQVLEDLVRGEFMQLGSKEGESERFNHYIMKTFKKTASLIANSCKAVALLGQASRDTVDIAYEYGRNVGIAFQLVDDLLDFTSCDAVMGKPTTADLQLGLATAPVLFASEQFPELHPMIMRRFVEPGDVERARELVKKSRGLEQTRLLARQHGVHAHNLIMQLRASPYRDGLVTVISRIQSRLK